LKLSIKNSLFIILVVGFIFKSCATSTDKDWPFGLPEQQIVELLADIHIVEGVYKYKNQFPKDFIAETKEDAYGMIYAEYSIDKMELEKLMIDLAQNPLLMKRIYEKVEKRIKALEKAAS